MPRMRILNAIEQYDFDSPPVFNSLQRKKYFDFSDTVYRIATGLRSPTHQLGFLVSCGYFPATKKFFSAKDFHLRDIEYVANKLGLSVELFDQEEYNDRTRQRHQQIILKFYGYRAFDDVAKAFIREEIDTMVRSQLKPRLIFWRCVELLIREKVQLPGCFTLTDLITVAINRRKETLNDILRQQLSEERREQLEALFVQMPVEGEQQPGPTSAYQLTLLKKRSQSTRPSKIKERVADFLLIERLYQPFQPLLNVLGLNHEGIRYYAHSVLKSEIFQVARRSDEDRYLHVVAFIAHQYYRLQDNLVDGLLTSIRSYQNTAQREHKEQRYAQRGERNQVVKTLLSYIDENLLGLVSAIEAITQEKVLSDAEKIERIKALLPERNDQALSLLREKLATELGNDDYHRILEARSVRLQNRVSPALKVLEFQGEPSAQPLLVALRYFKDKDGQIDKAAPMKFLTEEEANAIMAGDRFRVSLYKAFLFLHVQKGIKSGTLNLYHSYKYRPLEEYFIETDRWQQDKNILLERSGLLFAFTDPQPVLAELDEALFQQYEETNRRIADGSNASVSFDAQGRFQLKTPPKEAQEATPLRHFFPERQYISLLEVLSTVDRHSGFLDEFQHWQQRYHRQRPAKQTFFAGIIGLGCEIGTPKMARISQAINESELEHTVNWYFSLEGTRAANDRVSALMDQLELPETYRRIPGQLHTSSDGQKFEVVNDSLNASYSFKYAGKDQASSAYSFIDERHILWYSMVFSAAERESAFVIDGLMHNDVIKSDIHSTDTHGYSEALFGATHLLGFSYAPRIKNLKKQTLYIFKSRRHTDRAHWKIQPSNYIDTDIILRHWDDILRLIATIKLKEVTASEIFRRLNSYSTQHSLYRALKAFGQIIKSLFILRYIDDMNLRQAIEKQLNKIEHSHKFTRAVSVGNPKELIETEKQEQEIAESCKRLIKNCIICWNYLYLIQKLSETDDPGYKAELLKALSNGSVISWWHINLLGEYDFSEEKLRDTVGIKLPKLTA